MSWSASKMADDQKSLDSAASDDKQSSISSAVTDSTGMTHREQLESSKKKLILFVCCSFLPIIILIVQNSFFFKDMIDTRASVLAKAKLVMGIENEAKFITALQKERSSVALAVFLINDTSVAEEDILRKTFADTDHTIIEIEWRNFGLDKIFSSKLRFQIRLDDFRNFVYKASGLKASGGQADASEDGEQQVQSKNTGKMNAKGVDDGSGVIQDVLNFYNTVTNGVLYAMSEDIKKGQNSENWRLLNCYFSMVKVMEHAGNALVYGLKKYRWGFLPELEMAMYVQNTGLMWEYHKKALELLEEDMKELLTAVSEEDYKKMSMEITDNEKSEQDLEAGRSYFETVTNYTASTQRILDMLNERIRVIGEADLGESKLAQVSGIMLLVVVLFVSCLLLIITRSAITSSHNFSIHIEKRTTSMKKQQAIRNKLAYKMLPRVVVKRMKSGEKLAEHFDSVTVFFSNVVDFLTMRQACSPLEAVAFLNNMYKIMDKRLDEYDVYKVETISDTYLIASGVPKKNGDRHAVEICQAALALRDACQMIDRPDMRNKCIEIMAGVHTGGIVAGVVGSRMPRYCLFGDTVNTASRMQSNSLPGKIQISSETKMLLDLAGGFTVEERGYVEIKGKGKLDTFWLTGRHEPAPKRP